MARSRTCVSCGCKRVSTAGEMPSARRKGSGTPPGFYLRVKRKISFGQLPPADTPLKKEELSPSPVDLAKPGLRQRVRSGRSRHSLSSASGAGRHLNASPMKATGRLAGLVPAQETALLCCKREAGRVSSLNSRSWRCVHSGRAGIAGACARVWGRGCPVGSALPGPHSWSSTLRHSVHYSVRGCHR